MFSWFRDTETWHSPVGDPFNLDVINRLPNGRVDLLLVMLRIEEESPRTLDVICRKVENYCEFIKSSSFRDEFGEPGKNFVTVGLVSDFEVSDSVLNRIGEVFHELNPPAELALFYQYPSPEYDSRPPP
jgi:hypothetical protein